jgi:hypothetical protein
MFYILFRESNCKLRGYFEAQKALEERYNCDIKNTNHAPINRYSTIILLAILIAIIAIATIA